MKRKIVSFIFITIGLLAIVASVFLYKYNIGGAKISTPIIPKDTVKTETPVVHDTTSFEYLKYRVEALGNSDSMRHGGFGFCLAAVDSDKVLLEFNSQQSLVPASILKTVTTGICLSKLGAGFHYSTRLQYDGAIKSGKVLDGNLFIKGSGDPSLGSSSFAGCDEEKVLNDWVRAIKNKGIDTINGAIVGDPDVFDDDMIPAGWAWEDMQSDYGIGPCGLSFHENVYDLQINGNLTKPDFKITQSVPGLKLVNNLAVNKSGGKDYVYASGGPYVTERYLKGAVSATNHAFTAQSAMPDPAYYCANALFLKLKRAGVTVRDSSTTTRRLRIQNKLAKKERITFHTTFSPSLANIVWYTNQVSQNFYAESLLRTLSLFENGYGSSPGGVNVIHDYFKRCKIDLNGFYMVDGSGVSRFDAVSARQMVELLKAYTKDSVAFDAFYNSLPIAGQSGTLSEICKGTAAEKNIRAKSGYMSRVRSYAGYVTTKSGKKLVFAMLANNHAFTVVGMRNELEKLMVLMAELD